MKGQEIQFYGIPNEDDDLRAIQPGDFRYCKHLRTGTVEGQNQFSRESYAGNTLINNNALPAGTNRFIGGCSYTDGTTGRYIILFYYNTLGSHTIWRLNTLTATLTLVVQGSFLNFSSLTIIYYSWVVNGQLYWTTGAFTSFLNNAFDPPHQLDINEAIAFTAGSPSKYTVINSRTIDFIKWPAPFGPDAAYSTDLTQEANYLYGKMYKFRYRYVYLNNEKSAMSPISSLPLPQLSEFVQGRDWGNTQSDNVIEVDVNTGPDIVKGIEVFVSVNDGPWYLFEQISKPLQAISNNIVYTVSYYGNEAIIAADPVQRNYDAVPITSFAGVYLPSRNVAFINNREGFDKIQPSATITTYPIEIRNAKYQTCTIEAVTFLNPFTQLSVAAGQSALNVQVGDTYVFSIFTNPPTNTEWTVQSYEITQADYDAIQAAGSPNLELLTIIGDWISTFYGTAGVAAGSFYNWPVPSYVIPETLGASAKIGVGAYRPTNPRVGLFKGVIHEFALNYYDRANRDMTVVGSDTLSIYAPFYTEQDKSTFGTASDPYYLRARMTISSNAPAMATHYQILHRPIPVAGFSERTVIRVETAVESVQLLKLSLENYYVNQFQGVTIEHGIQVGDVVRIIRERGTSNWGAYAQNYVELQVMRFDPIGGVNGSPAIWVPNFDWKGTIASNQGNNFLIQIYTPAKLDENAPWREIGEEYLVSNPNTGTARHNGSVITGTATDLVTGTNTFSLASWLVDSPDGDYVGSFAYLIGRTFTIVSDVTYTATIQNAVFNAGTQITTITASANYTGANTTGTVTIDLSQTSLLPAIINIAYGDVYTRPRLYSTGFSITNNPPSPREAYYVIDDFSYSDRYASRINSNGRLAIESAEARQVNKIAEARHGGSFIAGSLTNNLCRFDPENIEAIQSMDEQYGPVFVAGMVGNVLKCVQSQKENSIYIQRTPALGPDGSQQLVFTSRIFGGWNQMSGPWGTIHPGSAQFIQPNLDDTNSGLLYYYDHLNGDVVMSRINGQQSVAYGDYKYRNRIARFRAAINTIGSTARVNSFADELNKEYALTLFDGGRVNPLLDMQGLVFRYDRNRWDHEISYAVNQSVRLGAYLISAQPEGTQIYVHGTGSQNSFYGTVYPSVMCFVVNGDAELLKFLRAVGLKTDQRWTVSSILTEANQNYPVMDSEINSASWEAKEGYLWARVLNDKNDVVPEIPAQATPQLALINGRQLRGYGMTVTMEYTPGSKVKLWAVRVNYELSEPEM